MRLFEVAEAQQLPDIPAPVTTTGYVMQVLLGLVPFLLFDGLIVYFVVLLVKGRRGPGDLHLETEPQRRTPFQWPVLALVLLVAIIVICIVGAMQITMH